MKRLIRWTGNLLVLAGICLLAWQFFGSKKTEGVREQQLEAFASLKATEEVQAETSVSGANMSTTKKSDALEIPEKEIGDLVGVLSIPQVDINAPVTYGATPEILDSGFGAIPGMDEPGIEDGSYAIAGHQSHVFGQFFNRIDELETGSQFSFETIAETQTYEVYDVQVVNPEEVEAIASENGIAKLSLVTCYPQNSTKHRLIVMAKRVDK
ncbi:class D sortase [Sporosarcina aquimarina]|uniref:Class D sortase n=1 Tax=Sporosarcina aquimarina TaxID=114975 RepID=A0ABU4FXK4_9BACL|nr:class D sortase [Sporosarcina aquimarina]MDW0108850.1 class D sortase [Sporosarcina aquimarina]